MTKLPESNWSGISSAPCSGEFAGICAAPALVWAMPRTSANRCGDNAGNPAPDIIGDATAAPAAPVSDADALFSLVSNPLPDLTSGGPSAGSSFGNSAAAPGGGGNSSGGGGGGAAGALGFDSGGGGAAAPVLAKSPSPAELFTFSPATPISVAPAASQASSANVLQTAGSDTDVAPSTDSTATPGTDGGVTPNLTASYAAMTSFPYSGHHAHGSADPLFVIDVNKQVVLTPGVPENDFSTWSVSLYAQVSGGTVSTYSWDTSSASDATSISGSSTYNLTFTWATFTGGPRTDTITITTTNTDSTQQSQTLTFQVWGNNTIG